MSQYEDFMARAYTMELEATERYAQFAEQLDTHNNREVAQLFRRLAEIEALHAKRILEDMQWPSTPALPPAYAWEGAEGPETAPFDSLHYLMQPWHALQLALAAEQRAEAFFEELARVVDDGPVRAAARRMQLEEREHVELVRSWLAKVPPPDKDWANDPDPPRYTD